MLGGYRGEPRRTRAVEGVDVYPDVVSDCQQVVLGEVTSLLVHGGEDSLVVARKVGAAGGVREREGEHRDARDNRIGER